MSSQVANAWMKCRDNGRIQELYKMPSLAPLVPKSDAPHPHRPLEGIVGYLSFLPLFLILIILG